MKTNTGAILLVVGCCIGAGMLGVPIVTGISGFIPSVFWFCVVCFLMYLAGKVLIELCLSFGSRDVHLLSIAQETLGREGKIATWFLFAFLFYAIMVAYFLAGAQVIQDFLPILPISTIVILLAMVIGSMLCLNIRALDIVNRSFMVGLFICYCILVFLAKDRVTIKNITFSQWSGSYLVLPIMVVSFGFHNLIPSLVRIVGYNRKRAISTIFWGSILTLCIYLLWQYIILGMISREHLEFFIQAEQNGTIITELLEKKIQDPSVIYAARGFAFFAIITSFVAVAFSFYDFLQDTKTMSKLQASFWVIFPPFCIALVFPTLFLSALGVAGGLCTVILFGLLPIYMLRKRAKQGAHIQKISMIELGFIVVFSLVVMAVEIVRIFTG